MSRRTKMTEDILKMMENPSQIRNIGLIGHIDHGKTTLSDSLLAKAGLLSESLAGEARVLDFLEEEQRRGITMKSANISLYYEDPDIKENKESKGSGEATSEYLINLVDTPGHLDFSGKVTRALRLIDGVVVIVDAVEEISSQTETVVRQALAEAARPILFINKIDRLFKELKLELDQVRDKFARIINDFNQLIDIYGTQEMKNKWRISADNGSVIFGSALHRWGFIIPQLAENKHTMKFFRDAYSNKKQKNLQDKYPIWEAVLSAVVKYLPNPLEAQKYRIASIWKGEIDSPMGKAMIECDPNGPLVICFSKVQKIKNRLIGTGRIFSGSIDLKKRVYLVNAEEKSYIQQLSIFMGSRLESVKSIPAGNIVAIGGIDKLRSGETVIDKKDSEGLIAFESVHYVSEPVLTVSVEPNMLKDLDSLEELLADIQIEDPNISINVSKDTGEVLLSGMGPLHLEVISHMIKERGVDVTVSDPTSVFYESIEGESSIVEMESPNGLNRISMSLSRLDKQKVDFFRKVENRIIKNQYLREKELREKTDLAENDILGFMGFDRYHNIIISHLPIQEDTNNGALPIEIRQDMVKIINNTCKRGKIAQEPYAELKITIESLELATNVDDRNYFELATMFQQAMLKAIDSTDSCLIEPIYFMIITCPEEYIGKVSSLISQHHGNVIIIKKKDYNAELNAKMSVRKSILFSQDVRNKTSGKVFWNSMFDSFQRVPRGEEQQIIQDIKFKKGIF